MFKTSLLTFQDLLQGEHCALEKTHHHRVVLINVAIIFNHYLQCQDRHKKLNFMAIMTVMEHLSFPHFNLERICVANRLL